MTAPQTVQAEEDPSVEERIFYPKHISMSLAAATLGPKAKVPLVHRQQYHEDRSVTDTYYLELTKDQYEALLK